MARKRSAHLTRVLIEGISTYSAYRGAKLNYAREYDPLPQISLDLTTKMDLEKAISVLYRRGELSKQEVQMLKYVISDGRLSRRDISAMIKDHEGYYVGQRDVSRRLESAYWKISRYLGFEYSDSRMWQIIAKKMGKPYPYILDDLEIDKIQQIWEKI
jgi:hypothetical protein